MAHSIFKDFLQILVGLLLTFVGFLINSLFLFTGKFAHLETFTGDILTVFYHQPYLRSALHNQWRYNSRVLKSQ